MKNLKQSLNVKDFKSGSSWNTYHIDGMGDFDVTPLDIYTKIHEVFRHSYSVKAEYCTLEDMMCFWLFLEQLPNKKKINKKKMKKAGGDEQLKKYFLKVAISIDDSLLFCQRFLSNKFQQLFSDVFEVDTLVPVDLSGSPPYELLLFHRQSVNSQKIFTLQTEKQNLDRVLDTNNGIPNSDTFTDISSQIGCHNQMERIPQIKKLTSNIINASFGQDETPIKKIGMNALEMKLSGFSIFDLYIEFGKKNIVQSIPEWIVACRTTGKTRKNIKYV